MRCKGQVCKGQVAKCEASVHCANLTLLSIAMLWIISWIMLLDKSSSFMLEGLLSYYYAGLLPGLRYHGIKCVTRILYYNTRILCVCLSTLKYSEREVVLPRCLHHLEQVYLASCTNCFSSLYEVWFERKSVWNFFASYESNPMHARLLFRLL